MANSLGMTISRIKWGYSGKGTRTLSSPLPVGASEVFKDAGGHFVWFDTSRRIEVAGSGNNPDAGAYILGWAECGEFTASSTEGGDTIPVDTSTESQYWMPADAAVTADMIGKTCDLITTSNVQYADVGESNEDYIVIDDVDITNQAVLVHMNESKVYRTGIA